MLSLNDKVLLVDWPLMTRAMIQDIMTSAATESASSSDGQQSEKQFSPLDIEGQVNSSKRFSFRIGFPFIKSYTG